MPAAGSLTYSASFTSGQQVSCTFLNATTVSCPTPSLVADITGFISNVGVTLSYGGLVVPGSAIAINYADCTTLAGSCIQCSSLATTYSIASLGSLCGWCVNTTSKAGSCLSSTRCSTPLQFDAQCPSPSVTSLSVYSGPITGGTLILFYGVSLGLSDDDIAAMPTPCNNSARPFFLSPTELQCVTEVGNPGPNFFAGANPIITSTGQIDTTLNFTLVSAYYSSFTPTEAPIGGGTQITITGVGLDCGNGFTVTAGGYDFVDCTRTSTTITCTSPAISSSSPAPLVVMIDGGLVPNSSVPSPFRLCCDCDSHDSHDSAP